MWQIGYESVGEVGEGDDQQQKVPAFKEYSLSELRKATNGFNPDCIVSESGEKAPNVVYRGRLDTNRVIAVKRFSKQSWPDAQQFLVWFLIFNHNCWIFLMINMVHYKFKEIIDSGLSLLFVDYVTCCMV